VPVAPDLVLGDALRLPVQDGAFDLVLMIAGLHHLPSAGDRLQALREMRRVMTPEGRALVSAWGLHQRRVPEDDMRRDLRTPWGHVHLNDPHDRFIPWKGPDGTVHRYYHLFTPEEMDALVARVFPSRRVFVSGDNVFAEVSPAGKDTTAGDRLRTVLGPP